MSKIIHTSECFTIRKINLREIIKKYFNNEYNNRKLPEIKIKTSSASVKIGKEIGKDATWEVYRISDKSGNITSIVTTNHSIYKYAMDMQNGKTAETPLIKCSYCKRSGLKNPIGLPIFMSLEKDKVVFNTIHSFCDFGCMYSHLKRKNMEHRSFRDSLYMNAEQMMYCMYHRMYPDQSHKTIKDKPDWELLRENGGPLTDEEFDNESAEYNRIPSIVTLPAKTQYLKLIYK